MNKISGLTTETYDVGFRLNVVTNNACYEGYIYHEKCGTRELMFALPKAQQTYEEALTVFENNLPEYIIGYINEYMIERG